MLSMRIFNIQDNFGTFLDTSASTPINENQTGHMPEHNQFSLHTSNSTSQSFINPIQKSPLVCGFRRCSFEGQDWNAIVSHRDLSTCNTTRDTVAHCLSVRFLPGHRSQHLVSLLILASSSLHLLSRSPGRCQCDALPISHP